MKNYEGLYFLENNLDIKNTFFISDTHFNHSNIIKYCSRPYKNVEEMDNHIIESWNSVVRKDSIVFHLGDFAFANITKIKEYFNLLNGNKILILGNHDKRITKSKWKKIGFIEALDKIELVYNKKIICLTHKPLEEVEFKENNIYRNLHGHIHDFPVKNDSYINLSVENINYKPILLRRCFKK